MTQSRVYLDHNASTPLLPAARAAMGNALALSGNPSSVHAEGRALKALIESGRSAVAGLAVAERDQVVFTGSATEALTQAIVGGAAALKIDAMVVSAGEHAAVLKAAEATGLDVHHLNLTSDGSIDVAHLQNLLEGELTGQTALVGVHLVNSETGVIQPIDAIEALVGPSPHFLLVDAVQGFGKLDLNFAARAADMMAVSAHKMGGPAGIGALLMKGHCDIVRLIPGGGQELGRRGGTESAALIAGFGAAAEAFDGAYDADNVRALTQELFEGIAALAEDTHLFGMNAPRLGNVVNFAVPGVKAASAVMNLDLAGIAVSSGSACSSGKVGRSHVLAAMGVASDIADCALRLSLGWSSTRADVAAFLAAFEKLTTKRNKNQECAA